MTPILHMLRAAIFAAFIVWAAPLAGSAIAADNQTQVQATISSQIDAFRSGDIDRAYSHAAPSIKSFFDTPEKFIAMVKRGYMPVYNPETVTFGKYAQEGGQHIQQVVVSDADGNVYQAIYTLRRVGDQFMITGVHLQKMEAQML